MVGFETPVIRATRRPAINLPFSSVVSFSSVAAVSPGPPFGQIGNGFKVSSLAAACTKGAAAASRQSSVAVRMTCHCLAARAVRKAPPRDRLGFHEKDDCSPDCDPGAGGARRQTNGAGQEREGHWRRQE